jgi:NNP family nitrate/nitrite transporter-like MFS transporter
MGTLLVIGAIPSGLAGTVKSASGLYTVRFFIGILGGTFVPCQAWTTAFFDKNVVGSANALVGGWGNSGGGFTFLIMVSLYNQLRSDGLSSHSAWRAAFAIVPVPVLLITAFLVFTFGTDHPAGKWSDRHNIPAAHMASVAHGQEGTENLEGDDEKLRKAREYDEKHYNANSQKDGTSVTVAAADVGTGTGTGTGDGAPKSSLDTAVNEPLTLKSAGLVLGNRLTWLPALAYLTTFGYELAIDANLANVMFNLYKSPSFTQTSAGYVSDLHLSLFSSFDVLTYLFLSSHAVRRHLRPHQYCHPSHRWIPRRPDLQALWCTREEVSYNSTWLLARCCFRRSRRLYR